MAKVTAERVRNRLNLLPSDVDDSRILEFIEDAVAEIELQTGRVIDLENCEPAEAAAVTDLAAIYCICYLTGGSAVGLNFSVGNLSVSGLANAPSLSILEDRVRRLIEKLRGYDLERV